MALKMNDGKLVAGSKRTAEPHATYLHYEKGILEYAQMSKLANAVQLSIPDVNVLAVLYAMSKEADFAEFVNQKLGRIMGKEPAKPPAAREPEKVAA